MDIQIYGNILVRTDGSSYHICAESNYTESHNVFSAGDIGFVDYSKHDYHITKQSTAYNFATELSDFPASDFENDERNSTRLDAGADQYNATTSMTNMQKNGFKVFPNPATDLVYLDIEEQILQNVNVFDSKGNLVKTTNQNIFSVSDLANGIYFIELGI